MGDVWHWCVCILSVYSSVTQEQFCTGHAYLINIIFTDCHRYAQYLQTTMGDPSKAAVLFHTTCEEMGVSESCVALGNLYLTGEGGLYTANKFVWDFAYTLSGKATNSMCKIKIWSNCAWALSLSSLIYYKLTTPPSVSRTRDESSVSMVTSTIPSKYI